jgi:hypothetical protein
VKPETKFYAKVKKHFSEFSLIRLENLSVPGTPDLLVYNNNRHFFTIELKVTKTNKIKFSPHQIGFHVRHPLETYILVLDASLNVPKLYEGSCIRELVSGGLALEPLHQGFPKIVKYLNTLGACGLLLFILRHIVTATICRSFLNIIIRNSFINCLLLGA